MPFLAWVAIVATPAYGFAPALTPFVPPVALATLAVTLLIGRSQVKPVAELVLLVLGAVLLENIAAIVGNEIGWAVRQGAVGTDAALDGLLASTTRAPYWLALAVPLALAGASLRIPAPCPPSTSSPR